MGKRLIIPGITSFTGPKIYADPIMSKGSLFLFDPTHPAGDWDTGIESGIVIPNIAADIAASILGITPDQARATILNLGATAGSPTTARSIKTRSSKGGLYGLYSHENAIGEKTGPTYLGILLQFLAEYMYQNRDHEFFVSDWSRSLRAGRQGSMAAPCPVAAFNSISSGSANNLFFLSGSAHGAGNLGSRYQGFSTNNELYNEVRPLINNGGFAGWRGGLPANGLDGTAGPWSIIGSYSSWTGSTNQPGFSAIKERFYIEDLTVSGRTYAEVDAIDFDLFTKAHAAGGAWFGDTYPNPATLP